jgi:hypothetical protein
VSIDQHNRLGAEPLECTGPKTNINKRSEKGTSVTKQTYIEAFKMQMQANLQKISAATAKLVVPIVTSACSLLTNRCCCEPQRAALHSVSVFLRGLARPESQLLLLMLMSLIERIERRIILSVHSVGFSCRSICRVERGC